MPIYVYVCVECGRSIDVMHGINGSGPTVCQTCGGAMRKALTAPAIHFKGSGWAKKDARAAATPSAPGAKKEDTPAGEPGGEPAKTGTSAEPAATPAAAATPAPAGAPAAPAAQASATTAGTTGD